MDRHAARRWIRRQMADLIRDHYSTSHIRNRLRDEEAVQEIWSDEVWKIADKLAKAGQEPTPDA